MALKGKGLLYSGVALLLIGGGLTGCQDNSQTDTGTAPPSITMDLPVSLSGVVATGSQKAGVDAGGVHMAPTDPSQCEAYFDANANPYGSGYGLARFLVGMSQAQTCFADFLIGAVAGNADALVGQGLISMPADPNDPGAPSHLQVEHSGGTYQVWLFFGTHNQTPDVNNIPVMYLTWTGSGSDVSGRYVMARAQMAANADPSGPDNLRVDFERTASTAVNRIYLDFADSSDQGGFRVDVTQTGSGTSAIYTVQGRMEFAAQPAATMGGGLPPNEDFGVPKVTVLAAVDDAGAGAAEWGIKDFAFHIAYDSNADWVYDLGGEFNLGSYLMSVVDKSYFDAAGTVSWQTRGMGSANYVNGLTPTQNDRVDPGAYLDCLEGTAGCDVNSDGTVDFPGLGLGTGYFTNTCTDADGADCTAMMQGYYDLGVFDALMGGVSVTNSDPLAEPTAMATELSALTELTTVNPDADPNGLMTFDLPTAP